MNVLSTTTVRLVSYGETVGQEVGGGPETEKLPSTSLAVGNMLDVRNLYTAFRSCTLGHAEFSEHSDAASLNVGRFLLNNSTTRV
jgi:hypothetical protein